MDALKAYLFDVDGVLSDPVEKKVTEPKLFIALILLLQHGCPVGLNTGRSTKWIVERVITPFLAQVPDKAILENFIVIGEKGGTWLTFDSKGNMHPGKNNKLVIPSRVIVKAKAFVKQRYHDSMFLDDTKETMLSIEMHDGFDLNIFHERQKILIADLAKLLQEEGLQDKYKIDATTIATDVENSTVGKALGAAHFEEWLEKRGIQPTEYDIFGDSNSDFAMADELVGRGKLVRMVYVGDKKKLGELHKNYRIEYIGNFTKGTYFYLSGESMN